jgi:cell division septum initiation protein DivIVA
MSQQQPNYVKIADDVRALSRMFTSVQALADAVGQMGRLQQDEAEVRQRIERLRHEAQTAAAQNTLQIEQAQALVVAAQEEAEAVRQGADAVRAAAEAAARSVTEEAQAEADRIRTESSQEVRAAKGVLSAVASKEKAARIELADLEARIEAARAQITKMLEG